MLIVVKAGKVAVDTATPLAPVAASPNADDVSNSDVSIVQAKKEQRKERREDGRAKRSGRQGERQERRKSR